MTSPAPDDSAVPGPGAGECADHTRIAGTYPSERAVPLERLLAAAISATHCDTPEPARARSLPCTAHLRLTGRAGRHGLRAAESHTDARQSHTPSVHAHRRPRTCIATHRRPAFGTQQPPAVTMSAPRADIVWMVSDPDENPSAAWEVISG